MKLIALYNKRHQILRLLDSRPDQTELFMSKLDEIEELIRKEEARHETA